MTWSHPFFHSNDHARQYISGTWFLYQGRPVNCHNVRTSDRREPILECLTSANNEIAINLSDDAINWKQMPVGFFNYGNSILVLSRRASRQWRVGMNNNNMRFRNLDGSPVNVRIGGFFFDRGVTEQIRGQYPTRVEARRRGRAFHPFWAYSRGYLYRFGIDQYVAECKGEDEAVKFKTGYGPLRAEYEHASH